jgi:DNA-binding NarL/FixJ family response regulator
LGQACRALADDDTAKLELLAARKTFDELGAQPDRAAMEALIARSEAEAPKSAADTHGLTTRELQVLRCLAAGRTNREIATELFISEHTVARHVQNIFTKISVATRTAAAAFAFEHGLS